VIMGRMVQSKTQSKDAKFDILRNLSKEKKLSVAGGAFSTPLMPSVEDDKNRADLTKVGLVVSFDTAMVVLGRVKLEDGFPKAPVGCADDSNTRTAAKERLLKDIMVNGMGRLLVYE
jgi:hypothetical protein